MRNFIECRNWPLIIAWMVMLGLFVFAAFMLAVVLKGYLW